MNKETLTLLARYNAAANEKMNAILKTLNDEAWNRDFGAFFTSIRELCSHIYVCDYAWMKRFTIMPGCEDKDGVFGNNYNFRDRLDLTLEDYLVKQPDMDRRLSALVSGVDEALLAQTLKYANSQGIAMEKRFGGVLLHLFNHHTHHRGMVSFCLDMMKIDNDFNMIMPLL